MHYRWRFYVRYSLRDDVTVNAIKCEIRTQAESSANGLISFYENERHVSSDFIGSSHSAIVDFSQIKVVRKFVTIGAWYDNEMGYSHRVLDLVKHMMEVDNRIWLHYTRKHKVMVHIIILILCRTEYPLIF